MRNKLWSIVLLFTIPLSTAPLTGCNAQQALNDVEKFAPVITNVLAIACEFTSSPLCGPGAALLNTSEQHVFTVWQSYLDLEHQGTAGETAWNDLNAAMQDLISRSQDVFALAHVVNPQHQKEVLDVAAAAQALLAVIESQVPPSPAPPKMALAFSVAQHPRMATFLPAPNPSTHKYDGGWLHTWEKNYNALPAVKARNLQLHRGFWSGLGNAIGEAKWGGN